MRARVMALTPDLVARVHRALEDPGPEPGLNYHTNEDYDAAVEDMLASHPRAEDAWLFAYGSLIWKPELEGVLETSPAVAHGWHRCFCMTLTRWRGTRERPALMLALDRGGSCAGVAFRLPDENRKEQIERLLRRETDGNPPTNVPRWIALRTGRGQLRALAFVSDRRGPAYAGKRTIGEVAAVIASAAGHWGSAASYLQRTVSKLDEHGIRDRYLWELQKLVAEEILKRG